MGRPAGEIDDLERRAHPTARRREALAVKLEGAGQHRAAQAPGPVEKGRRLAHGAQVVQQRQRIGIVHRQRVAIGHRQREAGALKQPRGVENVGERRNPRRGAAGHLGLRGDQAGAQLRQRRPAEERAEEHAVGLQGPADLDERAGQVVDPVQRQWRDDQVDGPVLERQALLVDHRARRGRRPRQRPEQSCGKVRARQPRQLGAPGRVAAPGPREGAGAAKLDAEREVA